MRILDSNIIIYASQTAYSYLLPLLYDSDNFVSENVNDFKALNLVVNNPII